MGVQVPPSAPYQADIKPINNVYLYFKEIPLIRPPNKPFRGPAPSDKGPQLLTERIRASEVRLIDGETNEVVPRAEAEKLAEERGLDLVVMSLDSSPPVVRLVDYGKFKFEAEKKAREAKKKQHVIDVKELKMSIRIDDHDYQVKVAHAKKFLAHGDKVKLTIRLKGRETQHSELAFDLAKQFVVDLGSDGVQDSDLRMEGRTLTVYFSPAKQQAPAKSKSSNASDDAADDDDDADDSDAKE